MGSTGKIFLQILIGAASTVLAFWIKERFFDKKPDPQKDQDEGEQLEGDEKAGCLNC